MVLVRNSSPEFGGKTKISMVLVSRVSLVTRLMVVYRWQRKQSNPTAVARPPTIPPTIARFNGLLLLGLLLDAGESTRVIGTLRQCQSVRSMNSIAIYLL